jgi:hypothetical protein
LLVSLSADAAKKKKKASKKHKTPAAKTTSKSKSKSSDRGLPPADMAPESDEASKEKEAPAKAAPEPAEDQGDDKTAKAPPPAPEPSDEPVAKPAKPARPPREAESEASSGEGALSAMRVGLGGGALFRNLTWNQAAGALAPYSLAPGPEATVWLEVFPAAFMTDGFAGNIGLYGHFNLGLGASSETPSGTKLTTKYQDFLVGLKIRIPVGIFHPYVDGFYGMQKFSLDPVAADRPNFNYAFAGGGAGARIQFTPMIDLDIGGAYLKALNPGSSAGEVASNAFYPNATAWGLEFGGSLGFRLFSIVGIRGGASFRQWGVSTNWKMGDAAPRAGGATDRNITAWGGVEVVFDGVGGGHEEAAPVKKTKTTAPDKARKAAPHEVEPEEGAPEVDTGAGAGAGKDADE